MLRVNYKLAPVDNVFDPSRSDYVQSLVVICIMGLIPAISLLLLSSITLIVRLSLSRRHPVAVSAGVPVSSSAPKSGRSAFAWMSLTRAPCVSRTFLALAAMAVLACCVGGLWMSARFKSASAWIDAVAETGRQPPLTLSRVYSTLVALRRKSLLPSNVTATAIADAVAAVGPYPLALSDIAALKTAAADRVFFWSAIRELLVNVAFGSSICAAAAAALAALIHSHLLLYNISAAMAFLAFLALWAAIGYHLAYTTAASDACFAISGASSASRAAVQAVRWLASCSPADVSAASGLSWRAQQANLDDLASFSSAYLDIPRPDVSSFPIVRQALTDDALQPSRAYLLPRVRAVDALLAVQANLTALAACGFDGHVQPIHASLCTSHWPYLASCAAALYALAPLLAALLLLTTFSAPSQKQAATSANEQRPAAVASTSAQLLQPESSLPLPPPCGVGEGPRAPVSLSLSSHSLDLYDPALDDRPNTHPTAPAPPALPPLPTRQSCALYVSSPEGAIEPSAPPVPIGQGGQAQVMASSQVP